MSKPSLRYLDVASLVAAAGGDPWQVNDEIQAGDPGEISDLADAFHAAGGHLKDADDQFNAAKKQFTESWDGEDTVEHPINDSAEVQRVSAALGGQPDELAKIAVTLQQTAAALATAQRDSAAQISDLNADLVDIDNEIAQEMASMPYLASESIGEAQQLTKAVVDNIWSIRGAYIGQLHSAETALMESGYVPSAIDESDAVPGDTPMEAVDDYVKSGQLERDRAIVANAPGGEKNHGHLGWSLDQIAADRRLDDYTSITDPGNGAARYEGPQEQAEAARLAGSRLADWNMANSVGPVAKDPVLGGDMRDRAKARLTLQRQLMDGQLGWSPLSMSADDATRKMNELEMQDRVTTLARLQEGLQSNGMSVEGAQQVADSVARGFIPPELMADVSAFQSSAGQWGEAAENLGEHMPPGVATGLNLSQADLDSLTHIGKNLGRVANALEIGIGIYEWQTGQKSFGEASAEVGGSLAGAWALGQVGAGIGAPLGPAGAFVLGAGGAVIGGVAGKEGASRIYDYLVGK